MSYAALRELSSARLASKAFADYMSCLLQHQSFLRILILLQQDLPMHSFARFCVSCPCCTAGSIVLPPNCPSRSPACRLNIASASKLFGALIVNPITQAILVASRPAVPVATVAPASSYPAVASSSAVIFSASTGIVSPRETFLSLQSGIGQMNVSGSSPPIVVPSSG